ncbi:MAG: PDZ domain-containing protein, partial [Lachnospiraceae bacterium]|nr:PDZ domain-containing protein [Lachnospiraceae bacterium]
MTERHHAKEHIISGVEAGSIAEEMGIEAGDVLLSVNGKEIRDIFDYRLACQQEEIVVLIRKGDGAAGAADAEAETAETEGSAGEEWELEIEKDPYEDLGLGFERGLMDDYRSCCNGCVFCFIDQMPKGMRPTLYFKDDDARLSFLQGNYVTLTNMTDREIDRILEYHLSPINVSFHTTNPELRCRMLRHPKAGEALEKAKRLAAEGTGIELNGQIVLCR